MVPQFLGRVGQDNSTMVFGRYIYKCFFLGFVAPTKSNKVQQERDLLTGDTTTKLQATPSLSFFLAVPVAHHQWWALHHGFPVQGGSCCRGFLDTRKLHQVGWHPAAQLWTGDGPEFKDLAVGSEPEPQGTSKRGAEWVDSGQFQDMLFSKSDLGKIPSAKLGTEQSAHGMLRDLI